MNERSPASDTTFLAAMAKRYMWDRTIAQALAFPESIVFRVMDLGTLDDMLALEPALGRERLVAMLAAAPVGAMRPRSWWFWHARLGLLGPGADPPPMPQRRIG